MQFDSRRAKTYLIGMHPSNLTRKFWKEDRGKYLFIYITHQSADGCGIS